MLKIDTFSGAGGGKAILWTKRSCYGHLGVSDCFQQIYPVLPFLVFLEFLVFLLCEEFLVFWGVFPFFSRDFRGSAGIKILVFLVVFLAFFPKNKERKDRVDS